MTENPAAPLAGVTVLDLSRVLAGPWATQILGDLGARVIKIEMPGAGDDTRHWGPPFEVRGDGTAGDAAYFLCANRNKVSVAIDFAKPRGAELVRDLARQADIVVENFKTGALARYGLDYPSLAAISPRLVYCSITGFGQDGPDAGRAGYDFMIQGMGGLMSITGAPDEDGGAPVKAGVAVADLFAGMYASNSILAALRHAERTGVGQHLDVSLFDCQLAMLANQGANYFMTGKSPKRLGNAHPNIAPYQAFETADRPIIIAVGNDRQFALLCNALNADALAGDARFATNAERVANRRALTAALSTPLRAKSARHWLAIFEELSVPAGPVNTIEEAFAEPQAIARNMRQMQDRGGEGSVEIVPYPVKFSGGAGVNSIAPPVLGADTDAVLRALVGLNDDALQSLRAANIID